MQREAMTVASDVDDPDWRRYGHVLPCPWGESLVGASEDELVEKAFDHPRAAHPEMADHYEREHILFMAIRLPA
jgi:predicted small metal-binding protein